MNAGDPYSISICACLLSFRSDSSSLCVLSASVVFFRLSFRSGFSVGGGAGGEERQQRRVQMVGR